MYYQDFVVEIPQVHGTKSREVQNTLNLLIFSEIEQAAISCSYFSHI